jgi:hypothetical protein
MIEAGTNGASDRAVDETEPTTRAAPIPDRTGQARPAADPALRHLMEANQILAQQIEPAVSRWLIAQDTPVGREALQTALDVAGQHLEAAKAALESSGAATPNANEPRAEDSLLVADVETLEAFANALSAIFGEGTAEGLARDRRNAAFALAVLLEDERGGVAAAAGLYQAILYRQLDRLDRVMELLPAPLTPLSPAGERFDFFARLLRCQCVSQRGGYAAGYAILLQIEKRCNEWFADPRDQAAAARAAVEVRLQLLAEWEARAPDAEEHQWCQESAIRTRQALQEGQVTSGVMRLGVAVPLLRTESGARPTIPEPQPPLEPTSVPSEVQRA